MSSLGVRLYSLVLKTAVPPLYRENMGNDVSSMTKSVLEPLVGTKKVRIMMLGIDDAGKTTLLYKLKLGEVVNTIPTTGFNVETVQYKGIEFTIWDCSGAARLRNLVRHYYANTQGIIYVVNSADTQRIDEARARLNDILAEDSLQGVPMIVLASKSDLPGALNRTQVAHRLELQILHGRRWHIQSCSAITGDGMFEGMDWLVTEMHRVKEQSTKDVPA